MQKGRIGGHSPLRKIVLLKPTLTTNKAMVNQGKCGVHHGKHNVLNMYTKSSGVMTLIMYFCAVIAAFLFAMTKNYYHMTCRVIGKMVDRLTSAVVVVVTSSTLILANLTK